MNKQSDKMPKLNDALKMAAAAETVKPRRPKVVDPKLPSYLRAFYHPAVQ